MENGTPPGIWWAPVWIEEVGNFPKVKRVPVPSLCYHCENPPCLKTCPAGAIEKRADGIVLINQEKCIGSTACVLACPYGAISFYEGNGGAYGPQLTPFEQVKQTKYRQGEAQKCTLCYQRVDRGQVPACVDACEVENCRVFGDLEDPGSDVSRLIREKGGKPLTPEAGTNPSVYYYLET